MISKELRQKFLDFFKENGHKVLPSASLAPVDDLSVLFTTAGMQQFKNYYLNPAEAPASAIATCQPCLRTSDIDEIGDETHLTFFEMLGNFSFEYPAKDGSYFKAEAIKFAWQFLTEVLKIDKNRIHATYFKGDNNAPADEESFKILEQIEGLKKIEPQGEDNFWSLGTENSPGGPTVEFYIDGVEIWNLVFNEYIFCHGQFIKSESRGIDTGMGLERLLVSVNKFKNIYETDLLLPLIDKIKSLSGAFHLFQGKDRIVADHLRAAVFLLNEGILPVNKDQGYIVRRLIRRAIVKLNSLGIRENALKEIAQTVFNLYADVYQFDQNNILIELEKEEIKFRATMDSGLKILNSKNEIFGKDLFDLYQSYGLPVEISIDELKSRGIKIDNKTMEQFNDLLKSHQELSRTASAGMFKGGLVGQSATTTKYHTATHLLLAALRQVLGPEVHQKGSNITDERIRLDFSWPEKLTDEQIQATQNIVNQNIKADLPVNMEEMSLEEAQNTGALGEFSQKYADMVKVYTIGDFSKEICGGPHTERTGVLGHFKIVKEESSSAGVRRIKAILE